MIRHQGIDKFVEQRAVQHRVHVEGTFADPMIGDSPLREIIRTDPFRTVAGAHLGAPVGGARRIALGALTLVQASAQDPQRLGAILVLRLFVLLRHHDARREGG